MSVEASQSNIQFKLFELIGDIYDNIHKIMSKITSGSEYAMAWNM